MRLGIRRIGRLAPAMIAIFLGTGLATGQDWTCPPQPAFRDGPGPQWEKWFVGSIGGVRARMHLEARGGLAKGEFYRLNDWKPVIVGGQAGADGSLTLHDELVDKVCNEDFCPGSGVLQARLTATGITGVWKPSVDHLPEELQMRQEPAPQCTGAGSQRVFRDPTWPITFAYPATWHVDVSTDTIVALCPDPDRMAYLDGNVSLTKGKMRPDGALPDKAAFSRDAGGRWQYLFNLAGGPAPAHAEQRGGLTIVRADDEQDESAGAYCGIQVGQYFESYVGLERIEDVLIVAGSQWVLVQGGAPAIDQVDLIVKSVAPR